MTAERLRLDQMPEPLAQLVKAAATLANQHRLRLYLVGGWLRDFVATGDWRLATGIQSLIANRQSLDIDFAVSSDPLPFVEQLAKRVGGRVVRLHDDLPTVRLARWLEDNPDAVADFTALQGDLESDLRRRDFTCNALAVDAVELTQHGEAIILDPLGGLQHIAQRVLVLTHKRALQDDPVRILRTFRFAATLGFAIAPETKVALTEAAPLLLNAAPERLTMELAWTLQTPQAAEMLALMDETGVLTFLLPELMPLKEVPAAGYHHLDGFCHTLEAVRQTERVLRGETEDDEFNALLSQVRDTFNERFGYRRTGVWVVKFATLLHDIGKPETMTVGDDGSVHFYGHEKVGAEKAEAICQRLRLSRREKGIVVSLVRYHMRPVSLAGARHLTERALRRFWRDLGDLAGIYCVALSAADLMATRGAAMTDEHRQRHYFVLRRLLETHFALQEMRQRPRLVTGHEIMERYGIGPSPLVGQALRLVEEAILDGRVQTKDEAWRLLDEVMAQWLAEASQKP
jgi:putative nucleotidyltransferase with HDIG domain